LILRLLGIVKVLRVFESDEESFNEMASPRVCHGLGVVWLAERFREGKGNSLPGISYWQGSVVWLVFAGGLEEL